MGADDAEVEAVARALFEADEDLNDASEAELRAKGHHFAADALGPRSKWSDPRNAPILNGFRFRARAAIAALDGVRGWRPIETAPKTAEYVLMARSGDNLFGVGAVGPTEVVWDWPWARPPTHWMPLPPAPEDAP